jgi:hypothetical protein
MYKFDNGLPKILVVGLGQERVLQEIMESTSRTLAEGWQDIYRWRRESTCLVGEIELERPSKFPVFLIGPEGMEFSVFEGHKGCARDGGILVTMWNGGGELRYERPRNAFASGLLEMPIAGLHRAIVVSAEERFEDPAYRHLLVKAVRQALIGAVTSPDFAQRVLFSRKLKQIRPEAPAKAVA